MVARRLVGFITHADPNRLIQECHLVIDKGAIAGRVTSVAYSPHRQAVIGLAVVDNALTDSGRELSVRVSNSSTIAVTVTDLPFYDPDNERQRIDNSNAEQAA